MPVIICLCCDCQPAVVLRWDQLRSRISGPDQITCRFLRELATEIAPILTEIFCQSLGDDQIPSDWRNVDVAPVFKKGNRNLAENYIPVSLTCVCGKLLEHIITSHIQTHLDQHKILSTFQHGFRKFFSCETQLLVTIQDLLAYRDRNVQIVMAVFDFSKAFDTVPHKCLLGKLSFYEIKGPGIKGHVLWTESKPIVHPTLYPTHISFILGQLTFPFQKYGY